MPATAISQTKPRLLLVDDDKSMQIVLGATIEELGYEIETAGNGADAFSRLRNGSSNFDIVVTDYMMPVMDGVALTKRIKREPTLRELPVVMLTGVNDPEQVAAGIQAGVFYFLSKPPERKLVASVLEAATRDTARRALVRSELSKHQAGFRNMEVVRYRLSHPDEVEPVASLIASMAEEPSRAVQGIYEILQNGIEHGVLGFGFAEKVRLLQAGGWDQTLRERAADPAFNTGHVEVTAMRAEGLRVTVKDTGNGFNWRQFSRIDSSRSALPCGRGISRAMTLSFNTLQYNQAGNVAVATIRPRELLKW